MKPQLKTALAAFSLTIISYIYTVTVSILVGSRRFLSALFGSFPPVRLTFPHWNVTKMVPDLIIGDSFVFHWPAKCKMQNAFLCIFKHTSVPQLKHFNVLLVIHQRTIGYSSWCAEFLPILFDSSILRVFGSLVHGFPPFFGSRFSTLVSSPRFFGSLALYWILSNKFSLFLFTCSLVVLS